MSQPSLILPLDLNEPVDPHDPFPYGWRYVSKTGKNGTTSSVQVPLTLEDVLHPREEDFRLLSDPHWRDTHYLYDAFTLALANKPGAYVLGDCRVACDRKGDYGHGPDIAVIFKVRKKERWSTFNVVKEKTRPALIVEVNSPSTRSTDLVNKVREYAEQRVPHYVIADARETVDDRQLSFIDYHLSPKGGAYYSLPPNEDGRVWLPEVKLWLGVEDGNCVCWDQAGEKVNSIVEEHQARVEAETKLRRNVRLELRRKRRPRHWRHDSRNWRKKLGVGLEMDATEGS
jgi:colicin import membrane protein